MTALARTASTGAVLARLLDTPALAAQVAALDAPALGALVRAVGLEDAGELVALATTEQLVAVFDEDLWRSAAPGGDDRFDAARFVIWLEVLLEAGDTAVARQLAALPEDLVTLALAEQLWVFDGDALAAGVTAIDDQNEADQLDKELDSALCEDLDGYQLISRRPDGWDAVLTAVLALDRDHRALLVRILDRLAAISADAIDEAGGLHAALTAADTLVEDAAGARDDRRAAIGHVSGADARAFLTLASRPGDVAVRDPITRAYFRSLAPPTTTRHDAAEVDGLRALLAQLADDDAAVDRRRALADTTGEPAVLAVLRALADLDAACATERQRELAYLANLLVAGASHARGRDRRAVRPIEAARAAVAVVDRGLAIAAIGTTPLAALRCHGADALFRLGWAELHRADHNRHAATDLDVLRA